MSSTPRLNRLFHPESGRCIDVAVDHGFFGEAHLLTGIEDMAGAIATLVAAGPDAIQLAPGQAPLLQRLPGRKPALVLRVDVTNAYEPEPPATPTEPSTRRASLSFSWSLFSCEPSSPGIACILMSRSRLWAAISCSTELVFSSSVRPYWPNA